MMLRDLRLAKRKKKQIVSLLLLTTVLIFLLSYTKAFNLISNQWSKTVAACFTRTVFDFTTTIPPTETTRSSTRLTTQSKSNVQRCTYKYLSPENTHEGRRLLDSITWPETPPLSNPFSLNLTTSGAKSSFSIVPRDEGWRVGDKLTVRIQLRDYNGNPKESGGDFLISRLHNRRLGAGVVGQVQDHLNGTFTAVFPLLWNGTADVEVMLVQTTEAITVLKRVMEEQPDRIFFRSDFRLGRVTERSFCNVCLDPDQAPLCNFTDLNTGEPWFCYKPKTLDCNTRVNHAKGGFNQKISKEEATLFQKGSNMEVPIMAMGNSTVKVLPNAGDTEGEAKTIRPGPSGYYYGDTNLEARRVDRACFFVLFFPLQMRTSGELMQQERPKHLKTFDKHSSPQSGPFLAVDHTNDIVVTYRCHGPPIRFGVPVAQLRYVANELDGLTGGTETVVVIGVWSHLGSFPMEVYYQRLMTIRRAAQRLLNRAPKTKVIIRTANMKALTLYESLTNSDWFSLQRDKVLRAVFKDMDDVLLLDAWEIGQAHYLPHSLHPQAEIIKLMIDLVLSNTCPKNETAHNDI